MSTKISDLSIPSSGCGDIDLAFDGLRLTVRYEVHLEGEDRVGQAAFTGVRAFRFREEMLSGGFEKGSYDSLVTLSESKWLAELEEAGPSGTSLSAATHYALLLSSNGYLEVVADGVEIDGPTTGTLGS